MEKLARRMVASEDQAYREFGAIFGPRFRAFFLKHGLTGSDAEDLAISCITDIALKVKKYKSTKDGSFEAWVFTIARNTLVDWWRKHQATVPLTDDLSTENLLGGELKPNINVVLAVRDATAQLSKTDQAVIQLRELGVEHSYDEIGEHLGIRPETARVRHFRALKRLASILKRDPRIRNFLDRKKNRE
jgi:RNA polymerase sigma-70 factor (ECF subfamily)